MNRIISRVALAALIATTVAPTAQAGLKEMLIKAKASPYTNSIPLFAFAGFIVLATERAHKRLPQLMRHFAINRNIVSAIKKKLADNVATDEQISFMKELSLLKPGPELESSQEEGLSNSSFYQLQDIRSKDINTIQMACTDFNRGIDREEQVKKVAAIETRLATNRPDRSVFYAPKPILYSLAAVIAALGIAELRGTYYRQR